MSVSYPYFSIAKNFDIDYGKVLDFVDIIEAKNLALDCKLEVWELRILNAWYKEKERRKNSV